VFTAAARNGVCAMESELLSLGIRYVHSRPYHPETCGKVCEHYRDAAPSQSDPGQGMTKVSFVRFVGRHRCCVTARSGQTELT
jgi:hypothetical protein